MCLIVLAYKVRSDYPFVFVANRDEFYTRATRAATFWPDHPTLLAGKDLEQGGTWCGIEQSGRFAAVTNYREMQATAGDWRSRGMLTLGFLVGDLTLEAYAHSLSLTDYPGFNLLYGPFLDLVYLSNRAAGPVHLEPGIHGLSNGLLNEPWPKVVSAKDGLRDIINRPHIDTRALFDLMQDSTMADDTQLPSTGVSREWERLLSPRFIASPTYGTRSTTMLTVDRAGEAQFREVHHEPGRVADMGDGVNYRFRIAV